MKKLLALIFGLALLSEPVFALTPKVAVLWEGPDGLTVCGSCTGAVLNQVLRPLTNIGIPFDIYNIAARTWGAAGQADSVWFRSVGNYSAIIIPYEDGQASGIPVTSSSWSTNFKNAAGTAGVSESPISGRWGLPVFVVHHQRIVPTASFNDSSGGNENVFVAGIRHTTPSGTFASSAILNTWRHRALCRLRGDVVDTLYINTLPGAMGCLMAPWTGSGTTAAIVWYDSTWTGGGQCQVGDTAAVVWRFRPTLNGVRTGPGIYHSLLSGPVNSSVAGDGTLIMLQDLLTLTNVQANKILVPIMEHDTRVPAFTATYYNSLLNFHNTLNSLGIKRTILTPLEASEYGSLYDATSLTNLRPIFLSGGNHWTPFSYITGFTLGFYNSTDTANCAQAWDKLVGTAARPDSFNFNGGAYDPSLAISSSGIIGMWQGAVIKNRGAKVATTTLNGAQATSPAYIFNAGNAGGGTINTLLGVNESRTIYSMPTIAVPHDSSLSASGFGAGPTIGTYEGFGVDVAGPLCDMLIRGRGSLYWHSGGTAGTAHIDPFYQWYWIALARQFSYFDKVIGPDNEFRNQTASVRNTYNPRY